MGWIIRKQVAAPVVMTAKWTLKKKVDTTAGYKSRWVVEDGAWWLSGPGNGSWFRQAWARKTEREKVMYHDGMRSLNKRWPKTLEAAEKLFSA